MHATGLELNGLAWPSFDVAQFAHFCDTVFHSHRVKLNAIRNIN